MSYTVRIKQKILKGLKKLPKSEQVKLTLLVDDLIASGPVQPTWPNYSKLSATEGITVT